MLKQKLASAAGVPKFQAPGPAFSVASAKGGTVWVIPVNSTIPLVPIVESGLSAALGVAGVKTTNFTTTGQTSEYVSGMSQAVAVHASAIMLLGIDPHLLLPGLAAAKKAGIPVILDYTIAPDTSLPGLTTTVTLPFNESAKLMADQAIVESDGHADILPVGTSSVLQNAGMLNAISSEIEKYCAGCKVESPLNVQLPNWSTTMGSSVRAKLAAKPKVNLVMPLYDGMVEFILPGISQAGKNASVKVNSFNGTPSVVSEIAKSNVLVGNAGQSNTWIGWATADAVLRALTHTAPGTESIPIRYWTKANAGEEPTVGYGTSYIEGFKALWTK